MKRILTAALLFSTLAFAQPGGGRFAAGGMMMGRGMGDRFGPQGVPPDVAQKLGIPPETVKKIDDAIFSSTQALIPLDAELKRNQLELQHDLKEDKPNDGQIMKLAEKVSSAELAVRKNRLSLLLEVRRILGPDLWHKVEGEWASRRQERRERFEQRFGGEGPFGGGEQGGEPGQAGPQRH